MAVVDLETRVPKVLIEGGRQPAFIGSGHLVFVAEDSLRAVGFDPETLEVAYEPGAGRRARCHDRRVCAIRRVAEWHAALRAARPIHPPPHPRRRWCGSIAMAASSRRASRSARSRPRDSRPTNSGSRSISASPVSSTRIWLWDVQRQSLTPLNSGAGDATQPVWTPDGGRIIFRSERGGSPNIYWQRSDGSGPAEPLFPTPRPQFPYSAVTRRDAFVHRANGPADAGRYRRPHVAGRRTELLIQTPFYEFGAEVSPDGRWLAYQSNESGQYEIYVRPLPDVARGRWQISTSGGARPAWARNGRELYYIDAQDRLTAVTVDGAGAMLVAGKPAAILPPNYVVNAPGTTYGRDYDVAADGRFLMIKNDGPRDAQPAGSSLIVIHNWSEELRRVVPVR